MVGSAVFISGFCSRGGGGGISYYRWGNPIPGEGEGGKSTLWHPLPEIKREFSKILGYYHNTVTHTTAQSNLSMYIHSVQCNTHNCKWLLLSIIVCLTMVSLAFWSVYAILNTLHTSTESIMLDGKTTLLRMLELQAWNKKTMNAQKYLTCICTCRTKLIEDKHINVSCMLVLSMHCVHNDRRYSSQRQTQVQSNTQVYTH